MPSGNAHQEGSQGAPIASGNTEPARRGRRPVELPAPYAALLGEYVASLDHAPLAASSRANYVSRVRGYLSWLAETDVDGDPLGDPTARDWAVRDYRAQLKTVAKAAPTTINSHLAALDDFHTRRGLGTAAARREDLPRRSAPKALSNRDALRWLRTVEKDPNTRDTVIALLPYYAGLRIGEVVTLDVDDVGLSARHGEIRVLGKGRGGGKSRTVDVLPELRTVLRAWLDDRQRWPGADTSPALLLNRRGGRLTDRAARTVITALGEVANLDYAREGRETFGPHVLRHTTQLVRAGTDLVTVAEVLGHARLDTTRIYTLPTRADRARALENIITDR